MPLAVGYSRGEKGEKTQIKRRGAVFVYCSLSIHILKAPRLFT